MNTTRLAVFLGVFFGCLSAATAKTFPQMVLGGGFEVVIIVANETSASWSGTARLREGNDQNWSTPWALDGIDQAGSSFSITLGPQGSSKYSLSGSNLNVGYLEIVGLPFFPESEIAVSLFFNFSQEGRLVDSTGVGVAESATSLRVPVERSGTAIRTGFAWAPVTVKSSFPVTLRLVDGNGFLIQQSVSSYQGHLARFFDEVFSNMPAQFVGSVLIDSDEALFVTALRQELVAAPLDFQLTSVPPDPQLTIHAAPFDLGGEIPIVYTGDAMFAGFEERSPGLSWSQSPPAGRSWVLIVEDLDSPIPGFVHWVIFDIPAGFRHLPELFEPDLSAPFPLDDIRFPFNDARHGNNDFGQLGYSGPLPPPGAPHRYVFRLYCLDTTLGLSPGSTASQVRVAMRGHVITTAQTYGTYQFLP